MVTTGLALLLALFLLFLPLLGVRHWVAEQRQLPSIANGGRPWQRRQHDRGSIRLFTSLRGRARFRVRRRGRLDRLLVGLRLAREAGLGVPAFDQRWLLECHADAAVGLFDEHLARRMVELDDALMAEGHQLRGLEMRDGEVSMWVDRLGGGRSLPASSILGLARPAIDALESSLRGRQYLAGILEAGPSAWPLSLLPLLWGWSIYALFRVYSGPDLLFEREALKASAGFAVAAATSFVGISVLAFRGSRHGVAVVSRALLGAPLVLLACYLTYREANIRFDRGPVVSIAVHRAPVFARDDLKRVSLWTYLDDVGDGRGAEVRIRPDLGSSLGVRGPTDSEASGNVEVMPGAFGHPWVSWFSGTGRDGSR